MLKVEILSCTAGTSKAGNPYFRVTALVDASPVTGGRRLPVDAFTKIAVDVGNRHAATVAEREKALVLEIGDLIK